MYEDGKKKGFTFLQSKEDIIDLKLKNTIIYIAEIALFFSTQTRSKELDSKKENINLFQKEKVK